MSDRLVGEFNAVSADGEQWAIEVWQAPHLIPGKGMKTLRTRDGGIVSPRKTPDTYEVIEWGLLLRSEDPRRVRLPNWNTPGAESNG